MVSGERIPAPGSGASRGDDGTSGIGPPVIGVLAVQGAFVEHQAVLAAIGAQARQVRSTQQLEGLWGLVLPGGESTTLGLVGSRSGLLDAVRERIRGGLPTLGTCAGMIMLAEATTGGPQPLVGGLDVTVRRNAFGRQVASFETELRMRGAGDDPLRAVFIRAPWVERAGPAVEVLAELDGHPVAVRQGHLMAVAFHPELTDDHRVHELFLEMARGARAQSRRGIAGGERVRAQ